MKILIITAMAGTLSLFAATSAWAGVSHETVEPNVACEDGIDVGVLWTWRGSKHNWAKIEISRGGKVEWRKRVADVKKHAYSHTYHTRRCSATYVVRYITDDGVSKYRVRVGGPG